ncbi:MAG: cyclic nucleotide-binding domain-containing protein, partial [Planctomycetes bacterium]|nr:cyclic nucleotide-binding domain-containing protein [Planctomycetota bacterium]
MKAARYSLAEIPPEIIKEIRDNYSIKADIKKLDIGGGMIHGEAADFAKDESNKIILAHIARPLSDAEKEIGSGAPFGTMDDIIQNVDGRDHLRISAYHFISDLFPSLPEHAKSLLMNSAIQEFNPEAILLKKGAHSGFVYLVLNGNVERLNSPAGVRNLLSVGAMIGEISALQDEPSLDTFRATNFVGTLSIPSGFYRDFLEKHELLEPHRALNLKRNFLQEISLFGDSLSLPVLSRIAHSMRDIDYHDQEVVSDNLLGNMCFVESGSLQRTIDGKVYEVLESGSFFGESFSLFETPSIFQTKALSAGRLQIVPGELMSDIPVIRWKLFETYNRRLNMVLDTDRQRGESFRWHDDYSVGVERMDNHHRKLFAIARNLFFTIGTCPRSHAVSPLSFLVN